MTGAEALAAAAPRLRAAGIDDPMRDAQVLLANAIGIDRVSLMSHLYDTLDARAQGWFQAAIAARVLRQPVSQIVGRREFYGRWFRVTPEVLDPRPDTETLIDLALSDPFDTVLDLGTGTGCILLTLLAERPDVRGVGTDLSQAALDIAALNVAQLGLCDRATLIRSNWWQDVQGQFDLIVSNPPYIAADEMGALAPEVRDWEPRLALNPGGDGLDAYRAIAKGAVDHLTPGGRLMVEIGPTQSAAVSAFFAQAGLTDIRINPDLDGRGRVVLVHRGT